MHLLWRFVILGHLLIIWVTFPYYWGFELESLLIDFDHGLNLATHAVLTGVLDVSSRCRLSSLSHSGSQERLQAMKLCNCKMSYPAGWWQAL